MSTLPLFPVTTVGSWPRPSWLLKAIKQDSADLAARMDEATLLAIKYQEDAGLDIISDGEQRRESFLSFITDRIGNLERMTMADLLEHVADKAAFETLLNALDVPAYAIKNPTVVGKLTREAPLALDDYRYLRQHTRKAIKVTLPGPYLICRSSWVESLSAAAYPTREELAADVVQILRDELKDLVAAGCEFVQFDEPVLSELAFAGKSETHTFMCAALAASASPEEELAFAVDLSNRVFEGFDNVKIGVHVCRGNWSQNEEVLLAGSYDHLIPHLKDMRADQFVLEYATPRAGTLDALKGLPPGAELGFGVVNPRTAAAESPDAIVERVRSLLEVMPAEKIYLNPDCGFGTFSERPVATAQIAFKKLRALVVAAERLRTE